MEKFITFSVSIKKEYDNGKKISYKLKFIDGFRFLSTSLSNLVENLLDIYKKKCKKCMGKKAISECKPIDIKDNRLIYKRKERNDKSYKPINGLKRINFVVEMLIIFFGC